MKQSQFQLVFIDGVYDNDREREVCIQQSLYTYYMKNEGTTRTQARIYKYVSHFNGVCNKILESINDF